MNTVTSILLSFLLSGTILVSCVPSGEPADTKQAPAKGKLFIIGGGSRSPELIQRLIAEAGILDSGYALILPMASAEEDTAIYYSSRQFTEQGVDPVHAIRSEMIAQNSDSVLSLVARASLIYISGGAQDRFMDRIANSGIGESLREAYRNGATIAGTSAGAAVMSRQMITGDQKKHPEYTGNFETIEANNIELIHGLGLVDEAIIDQHFIRRQRLNRLISVCLENPGLTGIGIDESTALLVKEGRGEVVGESQVIVLRHPRAETKIVKGLLGGEAMELSVYLPGDTLTGDYLDQCMQ
jgi:cyanophycinase